jgi:hypothetical protein
MRGILITLALASLGACGPDGPAIEEGAIVCVHRTTVCRPLEPYPAPETGQADCWIEERPCYLEENPIAPPPGG